LYFLAPNHAMKMNSSKIIAIIPARYGSTRFPGKSLAMIKGKPMIQRVYERTKQSQLINRVIVATDDDRILKAVSSFGGEAVMTASDHSTGTDRIAEVAGRFACDLVINVQGDEPLIHPEMIDQAIRPLVDDPSIPMGTLCREIQDHDEAIDPNVVKVVFDKNGFALYFSRAPIPWDRDNWANKKSLNELLLSSPLYKHIGLYVYRRDFLLVFAKLPGSRLEKIEKLEQLRALEHGYKIKTIVTQHNSFGVDIPDDLSKILKRLDES
jgi:3-deoxy-manno-octulosonate cytidylyltransferase (CMP-KDO synthetase)